MLNRAGDDGISDTGEGPRKIVLAVRKTGIQGVGRVVGSFKTSTGPVEGPELDGYLLRIPSEQYPANIDDVEDDYD